MEDELKQTIAKWLAAAAYCKPVKEESGWTVTALLSDGRHEKLPISFQNRKAAAIKKAEEINRHTQTKLSQELVQSKTVKQKTIGISEYLEPVRRPQSSPKRKPLHSRLPLPEQCHVSLIGNRWAVIARYPGGYEELLTTYAMQSRAKRHADRINAGIKHRTAGTNAGIRLQTKVAENFLVYRLTMTTAKLPK